MTTISVLAATRQGSKVCGAFYPLQKAELLSLKAADSINNAAYVHLALRILNPFCETMRSLREETANLLRHVPLSRCWFPAESNCRGRDRPIEIIPQDFAREWSIPVSSIYETIAKLSKKGLISLEVEKLGVRTRIKTAQNFQGWTLERLKKMYPTKWQEAANHFGISWGDKNYG